MLIDILHELDGYCIEYTVKDGFAEVVCPFHGDTNPSGSVSIEHGGFKCFACGHTAQFIVYLAAVAKKEPGIIKADLESRYGATNDKVIDISIVEKYHDAIDAESFLKAQLLKRCVGDDIIRERRLGAHKNRITIPVYNKAGYVVNLRKYRPGGEQRSKVLNHRGHGKPPRLYPIDQLKYDQIALCGGEIKALAAAAVLNNRGIGAICITAGEGNWDIKLSPEFRDKTVYIVYDIDDAGVKGAESVAYQLYTVAREVFIVKLPLDVDKYPAGDVNDFLAEKGDLPTLLAATDVPWTPLHKRHLLNGDITPVHISKAINAEYTTRKISTDCMIAAIGEAPYAVPKEVVCSCGRDQEVCGVCPVLHDAQGKPYQIPSEDPAILMMVGEDMKKQTEALKMALDIPTRCNSCRFTPTEFYHVEDVRLSPKLEISNREIQRELIPALALQPDLVLNETYEVKGRMHPHPKTQGSTLLISESSISSDALSLYKNENPHELNIFKPMEWSVDSIHSKLDDIYDDLSSNVTGIYGRKNLHLVVDLAYHSVLFLDVFRKPNQTTRLKGWAEVLILGDSAQGKTETTISLSKHYRLGTKVDCKNATTAGLLGGVVTLANKNYVKWGVMPTHDKRLVIFEELKGMREDVFATLTDMRSSGRAHVQKIQNRVTHARTRLIALSNPRDGRTMGTYSHGVEAIRQLIRGPEDIRRFDAVLIVSGDEVSQSEIQRSMLRQNSVEHIYTSDLCQRLVLWAWTVDKVKFEDERHLMECAVNLQKQYHDSIPLVNPGSSHEKIARLAAALAARTYSTEDYETLLVRKCHVEYIVKFLTEIYSQDNCKYDKYSKGHERTTAVSDEKGVIALINSVPNPLLLVTHLLNETSATFDVYDIRPWVNQDQDLALRFIGGLLRLGVVRRVKKSQAYYPTPGLIKLMNRMVEEKLFTTKPEFIEEEF